MALIEITVDHPSLISTGEDKQQPTDEEGGVLSGDNEQSRESTESTDDGLDDTMKNVSTMVTAATTIAGVLKQLREDEDTVEEHDDGFFDDADEETDTGDEEAQSFVESVVGDDESEADVEDEEGEAIEEDVDEAVAADDGSGGLGMKVAFVLVIVLIAAALWARGDDESVEDDWD